MGCLISPITILRSLSLSAESRRFTYRNITDQEEAEAITVVVGKERKEFVVEPCVLEEDPFRVLLMGSVKDCTKNRLNRVGRRVVWLDHVDSILFEHFLWLLRNDVTSFWEMDVVNIIDFYAQDF